MEEQDLQTLIDLYLEITPNGSEGSVIQTKGIINNTSHEYLLINNDFKIENGAELYIINH